MTMIVTTLESIPGKNITRLCGLVEGSTVRAKHIGKDIFAGLKQIVGGELKGYTEMMNEARTEAMQRMIQAAGRSCDRLPRCSSTARRWSFNSPGLTLQKIFRYSAEGWIAASVYKRSG